MKTKHISFLFVLIAVSAFGQQPEDSRRREIVIRNVNVVTMISEGVLENQTVVIKDDRVAAMGTNVKFGNNALIVDGQGRYLIPGLAEMHAHVPQTEELEPMKKVLMLFAVNGITTIRGMLGHPKHLELREMISDGKVLGPSLTTTGPSFNGFNVKSKEIAEKMVRDQKAAGYDYLKLHPGLTRETFPAIASTAREVGIPFVGHVSYGVGVDMAIEAGYSSIDHLDGFIEKLVPGIERIPEQQAGLFAMFVADQADKSRIPQLIKDLNEHNIWVVPTQSLAERWFSPSFTAEDFLDDPASRYMEQATVDQWVNAKKSLMQNEQYDAAEMEAFISLRRQLIKACQDGGVGLLLGCDAPQIFNVPGFSTHNELQYLVDSGLTPYEALRTGTVNVANYLKNSNGGVITVGAPADLVMVAGNPLADIKNTQRIEGVMIDGKWLSKSFIEGELKKLKVRQ